MYKIFLFLVIISILFAIPATTVQAAGPIGNLSVQADQKGNHDNKEDNDKNKETNRSQGNSSRPVVQISLPPVLPTDKPNNAEEPKASPSTQVRTADNDNNTNKGRNENSVESSTRNTTANNTIVIPRNRDIDRSAKNETRAPVAVSKTNTANTQSNPTTAKEKTAQDKRIVPPPFASVVQVKGINYYQNSHLTSEATKVLSLASLLLFLMGISILKVPAIIRAYAARRKANTLRESEAKTFTIPYYNFNSQAS